jgi:hypothetical protein
MSHVYTQPMIGKGTTLSYNLTSLVVAAWIVDISTEFGQKILEWTNLAQTSQRRMSIKFDGGEPTFTLQYLPATPTAIDFHSLVLSGVAIPWVITLPDTSTIAFTAILSKLGPSISSEEEIDADCTLSIDGLVVFTPTTS